MADQELIVKFKGDVSDLEQAFAKAGHLADKYSGTTSRATSATQKFDRAGGDLNNTFDNMVKGYLGLSAAMQAGKMFLDATSQVQKYENILKVASGTQEEYAKNTAFLEGLSDKYNKNVLELGKSYAKLATATRGTNLEGEKTDRLFAAVTATSSALQMSVDETNGTFQAFIQMVSKGNVQAEELRGQLGERLVGAFNLAAQAMGVSTQELNKMLERGDVLAADLLPKLTVELEKTFGSQAQQNANNLASNIDYAKGQAIMFLGEFGKTSGITEGLNEMASSMGELFNWLRKLNNESGVANGFFDRMFTLPGFSLGANSQAGKGDPIYNASNKKLQDIIAGMGKSKSAPFSNATSNTDSNAYGSQFGIHERNKKAEDQIKKDADRKAAEAERAINAWVSEQIQQSKDRIAEGVFEAERKVNAKHRKYNSDIDAPGIVSNSGTSTITGDGSATNYDRPIANMSAAVDAAIAEQERLRRATEDFEESFDQSMKNALGNALANTAQGVGELVAGIATGTADIEDVGNTFAAIIATLLRQIADALVAYAATKLLANEAFKTGNPYVALAAAAIAYGASAIAQSQINQSGEDAAGMWTGGVVDGPGGRDRVPIMATKGEMVVNGSQQQRLWGIISGAYSSRDLRGVSGGSAMGAEVTVRVEGRLKSGDIDLSGKAGNRGNNYFRVKRG